MVYERLPPLHFHGLRLHFFEMFFPQSNLQSGPLRPTPWPAFSVPAGQMCKSFVQAPTGLLGVGHLSAMERKGQRWRGHDRFVCACV